MAWGATEALYVRGIAGLSMPRLASPSIGVCEDDKGAIYLAKNPAKPIQHRTHRCEVCICHCLLSELVAKGDWTVEDLRTEDQQVGISHEGCVQ